MLKLWASSIAASLLLGCAGSCDAQEYSSLSAPPFGIEFDPKRVQFEPAPEKVYTCEGLSKQRRLLFVFGKIRTETAEYYLLSGGTDSGLLLVFSPEGCRLEQAAAALTSNETGKQVVSALIDDAVERQIRAFGGRDQFLCQPAIAQSSAPWLPPVQMKFNELALQPPSCKRRLDADLLGNGHTHEITLRTFPKDDFGEYEVVIGKASLRSKYFSASLDVPAVRIVKLDNKDPAQQMMVSVAWAGDCSFDFLSYNGASLNLLGTLESGHCVHEPEIVGNGEVIMPRSEGFWVSRRVFRLSGEPKRLLPVEQRFYDLKVDGVVTSRFDLYSEASNEPTASLDAGARISLQRFDTSTGRYEVWASGQLKGWAKIDSFNVSDLPWAD